MRSNQIFEPYPATGAAVSWLANHDLKALGYIGLHELGESTTIQLANEVASQTYPEARLAVAAYPITYAKADFVSIRQGIGQNLRPANYYTASRSEYALPVIGSLIRWSEKYDFPLVTMLSTTASKGKASAPTNTLQLLDGLQKGISVDEMEPPGYTASEKGNRIARSTRFNTLLEIGIIEAREEPPSARIINPDYKGRKPFGLLSPGRQSFYRTIKLAKDIAPDSEWTPGQLTMLALIYDLVDTSHDDDFQNAIIRGMSASTPHYLPGVFVKQEIKSPSYSIHPRYESMVHDLIEGVISVDASPRYARSAAAYAIDAYKDVDTAQRVATRGLEHSFNRKR